MRYKIANWMLNELRSNGGYLSHQDAIAGIEKNFGRGVYDANTGGKAIDKSVLDAFRDVSGNAIVWDDTFRAWRDRDRNDDPNSRKAGW
jgi:hypothetical protein